MRTIIKVLSVMLLSLLLLTGCHHNETPHIVHSIGEEYIFDTIKVKVENDEAQEQFILYYDILEQGTGSHFFAFTFHYDMETLRNSDQFDYYDNLDSKIEFNESGNYVFDTSRIFYVSYKNASPDVKNIINNKNCILEFPIGTFVFSHTIDNVSN